MSEILEIIMIVSFGVSWPFNVIKSFKARTAKGKSLLFLVLILFGYTAGITSKFVNPTYMAEFSKKWYVLFFYVLNFIMVAADLILYFRNKAIDNKNQKGVHCWQRQIRKFLCRVRCNSVKWVTPYLFFLCYKAEVLRVCPYFLHHNKNFL